MGIELLVGMLMMLAMRRDPEDRPAFPASACRTPEKVLEQPIALETAVGVQPVIAHADAQPMATQ